PALVAAATGYLAFVAVHGTTALVPARGTPGLTAGDLIGGIVLGVAAGGVARGFAVLLPRAQALTAYGRPWVRVVVAGTLLAAIVLVTDLLTGEPVTVGVGYHTIAWALAPDRAAWIVLLVLLLRCVATSATVGGGGVGGLFIPLV